MNYNEEEPKEMNAQEERELRRVFDHLASYRQKKKLTTHLQELKERCTQLESHIANPEVNKIVDSSGNYPGSKNVNNEIDNIHLEIEKKSTDLANLQSNSNKVIRQEDLYEALKALGKVFSKKEISNMIWEADENLDQAVDWEELRTMFNRNLLDKTNLEPVNLFNVVQFMTYDKKLCGTITADDTMAILFARYGRAQLEFRMKNLFGSGEELSFVNYLEAVNRQTNKASGGKGIEK